MMKSVFASVTCLCALGFGALAHAAGGVAFTDAAAAPVDFQYQGEYAGTIDADGSRWGAQVIALGGGKFHVVGYRGGLPGEGWTPGNEKNEIDGKLEGKLVEIEGPEFVIKIDGKNLTVETPDGEKLGALPKVERKSPTLGKAAPEGALVLFDGSNVDHWVNGELIEGKYLGATNVETKEKFGDHSLHLEFRAPFMPESTGQGRGNSGLYMQSRYEVQILDSFGLEGLENECGGIYSISRPKLNMALPPLAWQTYDVDFTAAKYDASGKKTSNARATVRLNGVVIHDNLELAHGTPGRLEEGPGDAPIFLQDHGNPVVFRNIWVLKK